LIRQPLKRPEALIWLIGNKGMLGTELSLALERRGIPFVGTDREVDITDPGAFRALRLRPGGASQVDRQLRGVYRGG